MKKKFAAKEGFTLVELIVVIAILGILAAVAVPAYSGYIEKANEATDITALDAIKTATMAACAEEGGVTAITITAADGDSDGDYTISKIVATLNSGSTLDMYDTADSTAKQNDFGVYYTSDLPELISTKYGKTSLSWGSTGWG